MINIYYTNGDKSCSHKYLLFLLQSRFNLFYDESDLKKTENGKLYIENCPVKFNISHSKGTIAVAFSDKSEIGFDIEKIKEIDFSKLNGRYFDSKADTLDKFYELWTTAEAFVKYMAKSIFVELKDISIFESGIIYNDCKQSVFTSTGKLNDCVYTVIADSTDNVYLEETGNFN